MALHTWTDVKIIRAINNGSIPSEELVSRDGWSYICKVRGRNFARVREDAWQDLCAQRGYLQRRSNSRGF